MKTKFLYKNILLVSITAAFALAGCNSGQSQADTNTNTDNEYSTSEPEYLHFVSTSPSETSNNLKSNNEAKDMFVGFDNVKLGAGINPITNAIYNDTAPNSTEKFFYVDSDGDSYLPVNMTATSVSSIASLTGSSNDQSDASSLDTSGSFGVNFGFVKVKAAASFAKEHSSQDGSLTIQKNVGAKNTYTLRSIADNKSSAGPTDKIHFAEAMLNANATLRNEIYQIRETDDINEKKQLIQQFYKNHGTHVVSSVDISQVASIVGKLEQKINNSSDSTKIGVSADFSVGSYVKGNTDFKLANANKFDKKDWNLKTSSYYLPETNNSVKDIGEKLMETLNTSDTSIIDFKSATPEAVKATASEIIIPKLGDIIFDDKLVKNRVNIVQNYNQLPSLANSFKSSLKTLSSSNSRTTAYVKSANSKLTSLITKINDINENGATNLTLTSYNTFINTYKPIQDAVDASGLAEYLSSFSGKTTITEADKTEINDAIAEYNQLLDEYSGDAKRNQQEFAEFADKINEFKYKYPTFSVYLKESGAVQSNVQAQDRDAWIQALTSHPAESPTYLKYLKQYKENGGNYDNTPATTKSAKNSQQTKIATKAAISGGAFEENYKKGIITDFNIIPWAQVFPELAQTATLNDTDEIILKGIDKTFDNFERKFNYLKLSKKLDATTGSGNSTILKIYDEANQNIFALKNAVQINAMLYLTNPKAAATDKINFNNQIFSFNDRIKALADLDLALNNYINSLPTDDQFKQWSNAYDKLKEYGFVGNYGNIPAYTVHNGFGINSDTGSIPMARNIDDINYNNDDAQKKNPIRTILELISLTLFDSKPVKAINYNPGNVEGKNTIHYSEKYNDSDFKRRFNIKDSSLPDVLSQMISNDNSQYNIMGIVPILTNKSIVEYDNNSIIIKNIALLDSAGNIWNPNKISNGVIDKVDNSTSLFTLKINKKTGIADVAEAKLYEYHWKFGDDAGSKSYNNMILLAPNKTLDTCWSNGESHFTPTCVQTERKDNNQQPALQIYPIKNQEATRLGSGWLDEGLVKADEYCRIVNPKGSTNVNLNNGIFFSDTYYNANNYFCMEQFTYERSTTGSGKVGKDGAWSTNGKGYIKSTYEWNKGFKIDNLNKYTDLFNQYRDTTDHIPHGLQLIPLTPNTLININNKISKDKQNPLFPTYNF